MKKILKSNMKTIIAFVVGLAIAGTVGIIYAASVASSDVSYSNSSSGSSATTVKAALDDLYTKAATVNQGLSITDTLTIDSTNQDKRFTYSTIPAGNYMLIEKGAMYSFGSTSYSTWTIGTYSHTKKTATNGTLLHDGGGNSFIMIWTFSITSSATPNVVIHNYYPNNSSLRSYTFWLVKLS